MKILKIVAAWFLIILIAFSLGTLLINGKHKTPAMIGYILGIMAYVLVAAIMLMRSAKSGKPLNPLALLGLGGLTWGSMNAAYFLYGWTHKTYQPFLLPSSPLKSLVCELALAAFTIIGGVVILIHARTRKND